MIKLKIKPVKKENLSENVIKQLKMMITRKELVPGQKLPSEQELAQHFGVGRHTLREALKKMAVMGMVESRVGDGSYITEMKAETILNFMASQLLVTRGDIDDLIELRKLLEISSAKWAALRASQADLVELENSLLQMEAVIAMPQKFIEEDLHFHFAVANATRNKLIGVVLNAVRDIILELQQEVVMTQGAQERALQYHRLIFEAIRHQDSLAAQIQMEEHLDNTRQAILLKNEQLTNQ